jgi:hypothetical protein
MLQIRSQLAGSAVAFVDPLEHLHRFQA